MHFLSERAVIVRDPSYMIGADGLIGAIGGLGQKEKKQDVFNVNKLRERHRRLMQQQDDRDKHLRRIRAEIRRAEADAMKAQLEMQQQQQPQIQYVDPLERALRKELYAKMFPDYEKKFGQKAKQQDENDIPSEECDHIEI